MSSARVTQTHVCARLADALQAFEIAHLLLVLKARALLTLLSRPLWAPIESKEGMSSKPARIGGYKGSLSNVSNAATGPWRTISRLPNVLSLFREACKGVCLSNAAANVGPSGGWPVAGSTDREETRFTEIFRHEGPVHWI